MLGDNLSVLIPSYNPTENLITTVKTLRENGLYDIIIVADGEENRQYFSACEDLGATVIYRKINLGKGAALKAGFKYCLAHREKKRGVVTVDGEGNHNINDIIACCEALLQENSPKIILGARDFSKYTILKGVRFSNGLTSLAFWTACRQYFADTQSSLRVIPYEYLQKVIKIPSNGIEYEINMLLRMKKSGMEYKEVKLNTVALKNRRPLHFHPVRDTFKIYMTILKFAASSLLCTTVDLVAFYLLNKFLSPLLSFATITLCTFMARAVSSFLNYSINKKAVFNGRKIPKYTFLRFYSVAIPQACLSAIFVQTFTSLLSVNWPFFQTVVKMVVDTTLFFISYQLQRKWVFKKK